MASEPAVTNEVTKQTHNQYPYRTGRDPKAITIIIKNLNGHTNLQTFYLVGRFGGWVIYCVISLSEC